MNLHLKTQTRNIKWKTLISQGLFGVVLMGLVVWGIMRAYQYKNLQFGTVDGERPVIETEAVREETADEKREAVLNTLRVSDDSPSLHESRQVLDSLEKDPLSEPTLSETAKFEALQGLNNL